jgi:Cyclic nucleotide-binding domain
MDSALFTLSDIVQRALDRASQNLTFGKILTQVGLDPAHLTMDAVGNRLVEIALANINVANVCALIGAGFYAATLLMRTMVPLRVFGIISILFFIAYGALGGAVATFLMYLMLLPLNSVRLFQMLDLVKKARVAARGDLSMDWLKPFMNKRAYRKGDVLFKKGQPAKEMFLIVTGKFLVSEIGVELLPGRIMGELGFLTPKNRRTQTVECIEDGDVLTIEYDRLLEVYFQNPEFGYYFLRLSTDRLLQNITRLEGVIEQSKAGAGKTEPAKPAANAIAAKSKA